MIFVKKLKFFYLVCLSKIDREKVFADVLDKRRLLLCLSKIDREKVLADVLDKKEAFKDYKNKCLLKTQN